MQTADPIIGPLVALLTLPFIIVGFRGVRIAGKVWFSLGLAAMLLAYVLALFDAWTPSDLLRLSEHVAYAASGTAFLGGAWMILLDARDRPSR